MNKALSMTLIAAFSFASVACAAGSYTQSSAMPKLEDVAPYPAAQAGQIRHVIWLPEQTQEDLLKVELVPGQVMLTDCNTRGLSATLTAKELTGWGYGYYEVSDVQGPIATLMACPPGTEKQAFVAVQGDNYSLNYNSKLPIVVYTPQDLELRYRVWTGSQTLQSATAQ